MSRLPSPGSDNGTWGQILNDFLSVEHNADGTLKLRNDGSLNSLFDAAGSADAARAAAIADAASKYQTKTFINVKDFGAKGDATANDTAAIQAAINYANSLTEGAHNQIVGGVVYFPSGFYITDTLTLLDNVYLHGGRIGNEGYRAAPAKLVPSSAVTGTSFMITQGASVRNAGIIGFSMYGQGGTTTTGCINLPNATNVVVSACYIDNWGAEALILGGGDCVLSYNNLTGLLNTGAVNSQRGAATISGGDHQISHNEFTGPSQYAVSSTNLYCAGALINTYSAEFDHCVFQTADVGCVISGGACNRFVGCRFDTNAGHGLMCSSGTSNIFAGCAWNRNSYSGAGNYDHINVPSGGGSLMYFDAPLMNNQSGPAVRYCINDQKSSATYHNTYLYPHGDLGVSGLSSLASSNASVIVNVPGASIISGVYLSQTLAANGAVTFNAASANTHRCVLGANATSSSVTNLTIGQEVTLEWQQDATGSRTYVWPTACKFALGGAPTAATAANAIDSVTFVWDGTNLVEVSRAPGSAAAAPLSPTNVQVFQTNGTWSKPAGAVMVHARVWGAGGGGGSGASQPSGTLATGGGGGGAGAFTEYWYPASDLAATVSITVGTAGTGGVSATNGNGNAGTAGGFSSFGTISALFCRAAGGNLGGAGTSTGAGAGGGTAGGATASGGAGGSSSATGGAGNAGSASTGGGGAGGGAGGGITTGAVAAAGGAGSGNNNGSGGGTAGPVNTAGGNGNNFPTTSGGAGTGGGGGGASTTGAGGAGGTGGSYAAGGGGGGASLSSSASGAGGNGGPGLVIVETYF